MIEWPYPMNPMYHHLGTYSWYSYETFVHRQAAINRPQVLAELDGIASVHRLMLPWYTPGDKPLLMDIRVLE